MCKLAAIVGVGAGVSKKLARFANALAHDIADSQRDGFGYAAFSADKGAMFGERWLDVDDVFTKRQLMGEEALKLAKEMMGTVRITNDYNYFGPRNLALSGVTTMILHGRTSTNTVSMDNTHPFVMHDVALVHNGSISNHYTVTKKLSTCDSEAILIHYLNAGLRDNIEEIDSFVNKLEGWFACAVLAKQTSGRWVADVFKDSTTPLYFSVIPELGGAKVYATDDDSIRYACDKAKFKEPAIYKVEPNTITRLDARSGAVLEAALFTREVKSASGKHYGYDRETGVYREGMVSENYKYDEHDHEYGDDKFDDDEIERLVGLSMRRNGRYTP